MKIQMKMKNMNPCAHVHMKHTSSFAHHRTRDANSAELHVMAWSDFSLA